MVQKPQSSVKMLSRSVGVISAAPISNLTDTEICSKTLYYDVTPFMYYVMVSDNLRNLVPL